MVGNAPNVGSVTPGQLAPEFSVDPDEGPASPPEPELEPLPEEPEPLLDELEPEPLLDELDPEPPLDELEPLLAPEDP